MEGATADHNETTRWALRLLAVAWLALGALGGWILFFVGSVSAASLLGEPATAGDLRTASWFTAGAGVAWASGPFGIWIATRRRAWLIATYVVIVLACAGAVAYLVESFEVTASR
jgi:hypothetical protein